MSSPTIVTRALTPVGKLFLLAVEIARMTFQPPFQLREYIEQTWFVTKVSALPTALFTIPFGATIALLLVGAHPPVRCAEPDRRRSVLAIVQQAAPIVTALLISGAGGSAVCADLGARTIREEIAAMEVLGISPIQRLVVPRVLAMATTAVVLNGLATVVGVTGGYFFNVIIQGGTPGAYIATFSSIAQVSDILVSEFKAVLFGLAAGMVAAYRGLNPPPGRQGRRRRGEPVRGHLLRARVPDQPRADGAVPADRPAEGELSMALLSLHARRAGSRRGRSTSSRSWATSSRSTSGRSSGSRRTITRYSKEIMRLLAEVQLRVRRADRHPRHGGRDGGAVAVRRVAGRSAGLPRAGLARRRGADRLHHRVLQHPRHRAAGRRRRADRDPRRRLHRAARRDADLRGDRRARGHGGAVSVPTWSPRA